MFKILLFIIFSITIYAKEFTISSYNVENLFDLIKQNTEYKEYIPNTNSKWNRKNFDIKLSNIIKTIKDIDSDIIALQEIENKQLIQLLQKKLPSYKYSSFIKYKNSSVGIGFLSKIKIIDNNQIDVVFRNKTFRPILETTFEFENIEFKIFNNHWPSKRVKESYRIKYAKRLFDRIKKLPRDYDYILIGDFNSNYNESQSLKYDKKLNNTDGLTGINHVLNTTLNNEFNIYEDITEKEKVAHYNLWLDLKEKDRFSNKFRKQNQTPDNIIIPKALFDNKKISYIKNSFTVVKPSYLYTNNQIKRWQIKNSIHQGKGYSDHLPIKATFSTSSNKKNNTTIRENITKISQLYNVEKIIEPIIIDDIIVIYKNNNNAILKQLNNRAIYFYNNSDKLKLGYSYKLKINQIKSFNGLKEVTNFEILKENYKYKNVELLYLDTNKIEFLDNQYQNELITNLKGTVHNRKLLYKDKSINLYSKDKSLLPKNKENIEIISGHLSIYKGNLQIQIHKKTDYKVVK